MKGEFIRSFLMWILFSAWLGLLSCSEDEEKIPPAITFKQDSEYTSDGAVVEVGHKLIFGIQARASSANITNFTIKKVLTDGSVITVMDTGMNSGNLDLVKTFYQNIENEVEWTFTAMDKNRLSSQISLTVFKDPDSQFGGIYYYPSIKMGYQNNIEFGHFLDPFSGKVYFEDSATLFQQDMHFLVYYIVDDDLPSPVFSSSGEMDNFSTEAQTFYPSIVDWLTRRYTLWDISVDDDPIPAEDFDKAFNDSLLIVSYDEVRGKKKFKWATSGRVIPFKTATGKFGLVKVINAEHSEDGTVEFALKIQQ
jgi:hypothetical protein